MKKKTYASPQTDIVCMETESIICNSDSLKRGRPSDDDDYQPEKDTDGYWLAE